MEEGAKELRTSSLEDIRLDVFEGPFDLLLTLLERNKLDVADVSVNLIVDQYMEVLSKNFDMEIASEFLVMASTLLHLKSRRLLPKEEVQEEEISEEELISRLKEYRRYKEIAPTISNMYTLWSGAMYKLPEPLDFPKIYLPVKIDPSDLKNAYGDILKRNVDRKNDTSSQMERILRVEKVSIKDKMRQIVSRLAGKVKSKFSEIFSHKASKMEQVTGFLAILELDRRKRITISQEKLFDEIIISKGDEFDQTDLSDFEQDSVDEYDEKGVQ